jgi:hypothetical protein
MKKTQIKLLGISLLMIGLFSSCTDELNQSPDAGSQLPADEVFSNPASYKQVLSKLYAGFSTTGQVGNNGGAPDILGINEGESQYVRGLFLLQELSTDVTILGWNDDTVKDFHYQTWTSSDKFLNAMYSRFAYQVVGCTEFLKQTSEAKLAGKGLDASLLAEIKTYRAEARLLRAITYWHLLDTFGAGSILTEESPNDFNYPPYSSRQELYTFVDSELTAIEDELKDPKTNEAFRADKACAWMLHAKLYLNAKVYTGTPNYDGAATYINKIISSGKFSLVSNYKYLFLADNDRNGSQNETILTAAYDGLKTTGFGGTTFLTHAGIDGDSKMPASEFGIASGWGGYRSTSTFVGLFDGNTTDVRGNFYKTGHTLENLDVSSFYSGYAFQKFRNVKVDGSPGSDPSNFVDTDFPIFRYADVLLMYAECQLRGAGGTNAGDALTYVNAVRTRANAPAISAGQLTLPFILDERGRELYLEGHRRTDLIRFGKFTGGSYLWPWKGGVYSGSPTQSYRDLYPIPAATLANNQTYKQNPGY